MKRFIIAFILSASVSQVSAVELNERLIYNAASICEWATKYVLPGGTEKFKVSKTVTKFQETIGNTGSHAKIITNSNVQFERVHVGVGMIRGSSWCKLEWREFRDGKFLNQPEIIKLTLSVGTILDHAAANGHLSGQIQQGELDVK